MKNKLSKKRMPLIALLTTVLMFFCFVPVLSAASVAYGDSEEDTWTYQDCLQMRSYLYNNFETFVDEYNKTVDEGNALKASSIEYSSIINLIEDENYGVYFDFDGDNGYAVITGGYTIYELTVAGDYKCLRNSNKLYYSYLDGFVELDENGVYQRVFQNEEKPIGGSVYYGMPESDSGSSGDTEWKDGEIKIDEIDDYIKTHYPSYKFITKNESLRDSSLYYNQFNTSYYIQNICDADGNFIEGEGAFSEGNCMLSAMYTVLSDWANCSLISDKIDFKSTANIIDSIKFDWLYDKYCDSPVMIKSGKGKGGEGDRTVYYKWGVNYNSNLRNMPVLYSNIREFAVCDYGYTPESGFKTSDVPQLLSAVANRYKVSINVSYTTLKAVALNSINEGKAVLLGINGSSSYHNHGVTIVGYQQYGLFKPIDSFNFVGQKHFFLVADNWHKESRYFDPNTDAKPALSYCILQNEGG